MDVGNVVVVVLGVLVVATVLGVALVVIVLRGIRGENVQWPVRTDTRHVRKGPELTTTEAGPAAEIGPEAREPHDGENPARPAGTREEGHTTPGRARWW